MKRNVIKVKNIDSLLEYESVDDYYKSPFEILANLDNELKYIDSKKAPESILISYKEHGDAIFYLHQVIYENHKTILIYEFISFIS